MVGSDDFYTGSMNSINDLGNNLISGKDLDIDKIYIAGLCSLDI